MLVLGSFYYSEILFQRGILAYLLFIVLLGIGIFTNLLLIANLSSLTFVLKRMVPADFIFSEISKVMAMPFTIYSRKVGVSLALFIPSLFCSAIPSAVAIHGDYSLALYLVGGFIATFCTFVFLFNYTFSKFEGVGG